MQAGRLLTLAMVFVRATCKFAAAVGWSRGGICPTTRVDFLPPTLPPTEAATQRPSNLLLTHDLLDISFIIIITNPTVKVSA